MFSPSICNHHEGELSPSGPRTCAGRGSSQARCQNENRTLITRSTLRRSEEKWVLGLCLRWKPWMICFKRRGSLKRCTPPDVQQLAESARWCLKRMLISSALVFGPAPPVPQCSKHRDDLARLLSGDVKAGRGLFSLGCFSAQSGNLVQPRGG